MGGEHVVRAHLVLTVRAEPGAAAGVAVRVRLTCTPCGRLALDEVWDLAALDPGAEARTVRRVAAMVARMRRLGCRCRFDVGDLDALVDFHERH